MFQSSLKKLFFFGFVFLFLVVFHFKEFSKDSNELVPIELSRWVAHCCAGEIFGQVKYLFHEVYYDMDDQPLVYVFTFSRKPGLMPSVEGIKNKLKIHRMNWWKTRKTRNSGQSNDEKNGISGMAEYWKGLRQEEDFVTVFASALTNQVPVIQMYEGLPPHLVVIEDAKEVAATMLKRDSICLRKYHYVMPFTTEIEFSDHSGKRLMVNALDFQIRDIDFFKQKKLEKIDVDPERKITIKETWNLIKSDRSAYHNKSPDIVGVSGESEFESVIGHHLDDPSTACFIPGVPDYNKIDYVGKGDCAPTATACVLGYWDAHGYPDLLDQDDVYKLIFDIEKNSDYHFDRGGASEQSIAESIEIVCNDPDLGNNYGFSTSYNENPSFDDVMNELSSGRPILHQIQRRPYGNHSMAGVGYFNGKYVQYCIDHDNWATTPENILFAWYSTQDRMTSIVPGEANNKTISGFIRTSNGSAVSDASITFRHFDYQTSIWMIDGVAFSNARGHYHIDLYYCWNGIATPSKSSFRFDPANISYDDVMADKFYQNYVIH